MSTEKVESTGSLPTVLAADTGTVIVREMKDGRVYLGLRKGNRPEGAPDLLIRLTTRQRSELVRTLLPGRKAAEGEAEEERA